MKSRLWISAALLISIVAHAQSDRDQISALKEDVRIAQAEAHTAKSRADDALDELSQVKVQLANAISAINDLHIWADKVGVRLADQDFAAGNTVAGYADLRRQQSTQREKEHRASEFQSAQSVWLRPMLMAEARAEGAHEDDPLIPDPNGAIIRKLADDSVIALIGGQAFKFKTKAEADQFIAKRKAEVAGGAPK